MPTYEYECTDCGRSVEVAQRFDEESLRICPRCGGNLRKVFHPANVVFRGSGFYATDSRAKAKSDGGTKETGKGTPKAPADAKADPKAPAEGGTKEKSA
jgi:putative FmdB family regulatory protein